MSDPGDTPDDDHTDVTLDDDGTLAGAAVGDDELGVPVDPGPGFGMDDEDDALAEDDADG